MEMVRGFTRRMDYYGWARDNEKNVDKGKVIRMGWGGGFGKNVTGEMLEDAGKYYLKSGDIDRAIRCYKKLYSYLHEHPKEARKYGKIIRRLEKVKRKEWHGLEGRTASAVAAIVGLFFGALLLSSNFLSSTITGNVIGSNTSANLAGLVLFIIGVIGAMVYFIKR